MARRDGREPAALRAVEVIPGFHRLAEGSCLYRAAGTVVLCTASVSEDVPPHLKDTGRGWVTAEYQMHPRISPGRRESRDGRGKAPSGRTQEIQRLIGRALRAAVHLDRLGARTITVDCDVLEADGGTRTASITGGFIALAIAIQKLHTQGRFAAPAQPAGPASTTLVSPVHPASPLAVTMPSAHLVPPTSAQPTAPPSALAAAMKLAPDAALASAAALSSSAALAATAPGGAGAAVATPSGLLSAPVAAWSPLRDQVAAVSVGYLDGAALLDLDYSEDSRARVDLNLVATSRAGIVEVQGTAEDEALPRPELDRLVDVGLAGVIELCAIQRRVLASVGVDLTTLGLGAY